VTGAVNGQEGASANGPESAPARPPIRVDGQRQIRASRERAWAVLTDPVAVAACLPVPATAEASPPDGFRVTATVTVIIFPLRVVVDGQFVERVTPERAVVAATAVVPGGSVAVEARLELDAGPGDATTLRWQFQAVPAGSVAALAGDRVPAAVLEAMERTLACLATRIEA